MNDLSGQYLGRYHLTERLGEGGMAVVYKAYDTRLERDVAIKIIRSGAFPIDSLGEILKRFEREAKSLAKLSHPNIVKVYDYGEHEDEPFLVMEYLPGGTLRTMLGKPQPWQDALRLILPVARGVAYAHQHGVLHRDIKPANVLMTDGGEPMLSDFGIAKLFGGDHTTTLTGSGMAIGTPDYMAPEQWTGITSPQSDLYSLAIVLYEMVTGRKPYVADTPAELLIKQATQPLPSPRDFAADLPETVEQVLLTSLAREPKDRYESIAAFIRALENLEITAPIDPTHAPKKPVEKTVKLSPPEPVVHVLTKTFPKVARDTVRAEGIPSKKETSKPAGPSRASKSIKTSRTWLGLLGVTGVAISLWLASPSIGKWFVYPSDTPGSPAEAFQLSTATPSIEEGMVPNTPFSTLTPITSTTATPISDIGSSFFRQNDGMEMVYVPAGDFYMGSSCAEPGCVYKQGGRLESTEAFWIDKTEIANAMYAKCVLDGGCTPILDLSLGSIRGYYGNDEYDNYPVVNVTIQQAEMYCGWSSGRLPNSREWEKAARGKDGRGFPWGDEFKGYEANSCDIKCNDPNSRNPDLNDGYTFTAPVDSFSNYPSPYGTLNMAGNVREIVEEGNFRGGAWNTPGRHLWTFSLILDDSAPSDAIGFRCIIPIVSTSTAPTSEGIESSKQEDESLPTEIKDTKGITMHLVPAGEFTMGSENGDKNEQPVHQVYVDAFYIDIYEVTNAAYKACVTAGGCTPPQQYYGNSQYSDYPVIYVDWIQAKTYCEWRGGSLPTEAQWEKAARGDLDGMEYPWGNQAPVCQKGAENGAKFDDNDQCQDTDTEQVGNYAPNGYGLYDMAGNVWEWTSSLYQSYPYNLNDGREDFSASGPRVIRGGSWENIASLLRSSNRGMRNLDSLYGVVGFRCARSLP